jgi:glycine cleavage system H protein
LTTIPSELFFTPEHEWVRDPGGPAARVGVTEYAADQLGDVVFVELPQAGDRVVAGEPCGDIESTKSISTVFAPVTGLVTAVNGAVLDAPELINRDPFGEGWLFEVAPEADLEGPDALLDGDAYADLTAEG